MAREIEKLSARSVATKKKPGVYGDGVGLYLQIGKSGSKSWLFRFMLNGKAREMGLGAVHTISLAEARIKAAECRKLVKDGIDPIEARKAEDAAKKLGEAKAITFAECVKSYIDAHRTGWRNAKHATQWENTLKAYAEPVLGKLSIADIDTGLVLQCLEPIWKAKTETATRVRGRIEAVLDWAAARGFRQGENPARWRGHMDKLLPKRSKVKTVKHHPALPYAEMGGFMKLLREQEGIGARALEFAILTAARTNEVIGAEWKEIDLKAGVWTVPASRMKAHKEHRVPLSSRAIVILKEMQKVQLNDYVFPGARESKPLSSMALLMALRRMGRGDLTAHGFRSSFRDWAAEMTAYPREVAEMALAHTIGDKVEAAYRRGDLFNRRRRMMEDWAKHSSTSRQGEVVPMNRRKK